MSSERGIRSITVVRPYPAFIRERVLDAVTRAGYVVRATIPAGAPDLACELEILGPGLGDAVLVPFHAHKLADGTRSSGPEVLDRIKATARQPVIFPASEGARFAVEAWTRKNLQYVNERVLMLWERDLALDVVVLADRIRRHIERVNGASSSGGKMPHP